MASKKLKHKLGTVEYEYNDQVAWTETDQLMADGVAHCLLTNDRAVEETDALWKRSMELDKDIERLNELHTKVGELLKKAQDLAGGYVGAMELGQFSYADLMVEATNAANDAIQEQNRDATEVHGRYSALNTDRNLRLEQDEKDGEEVYSKLNDLFLVGYEAGNVATDLMSFDDATERVRSILSVSDQHQSSKIDRVYEVIRDFELLLAKIDGQQKVWEEYCSRLILIEYIGKLRSGNSAVSFN